MTDTTRMDRALGRLLLASAALVMPLAAAGAETGPAAPNEPQSAPQVRERRIVIVTKDAAAEGADAQLETREIKQDGRTIIIKTNKAMSDAEVDAQIAKAMAPGPDGTAAPGLAERRVIVRRLGPDGAPHDRGAGDADLEKMAMACAADGKSSTFESSEQGQDGKPRKIVMRFCSAGAPGQTAGDGLKAARERIAKDANLSPAVRDGILKQLDAEIERLSKQG